MRRNVFTLAVAAALGGVAVLAALRTWPQLPRGRTLDVYLLFLGALLMFAFVQATRAAAPDEDSVFERVLRRRARRVQRPRSLTKLEREVALASATAFDFHSRLLPTLREIAAYKLAGRGIALDSGSPAARAALGPDLWEVLRPDRPAPEDRHAPGVPLARVRAMLDELDKI